MSKWNVGLSAWIIQDGNYGDFARQQKAKFALEFFPHQFRHTDKNETLAECMEGSRYRVTTQVVLVMAGAWVIDLGIQAFQQAQPPKGIGKGDWIEADIYLGIDPFFYFEDLAHAKEMPPLVYSWLVSKIGVQTAPFIETRDQRGARVLVRDESKSAYREIDATQCWSDDNGNGEYVLECELLDAPPSRCRD